MITQYTPTDSVIHMYMRTFSEHLHAEYNAIVVATEGHKHLYTSYMSNKGM